MGQAGAAAKEPVAWKELPPEIIGPVWDTADMSIDELLHQGIAQAQVAASEKIKHLRIRHLYTARGLLLAAIRKSDPDELMLRAHLMAVLLKLGEEASTVQLCLSEEKKSSTAPRPAVEVTGQDGAKSQQHSPTSVDRRESGGRRTQQEKRRAEQISTELARAAASTDQRSPSSFTGCAASGPSSPKGSFRRTSELSSSNSSLCTTSDPDSLGRRASATGAAFAGSVTHQDSHGSGEVNGMDLEDGGSHSVLTPPAQSLTPAADRATPLGSASWAPFQEGWRTTASTGIDTSAASASFAATASESWNWPTTTADFRRVGHARMRSNQSQSQTGRSPEVDTLSLAPSLAQSGLASIPSSPFPCASPFIGTVTRDFSPTPTPPSASRPSLPRSDRLFVKILNGVSGEEEARFSVAVSASGSEREFLSTLDKHCQDKAGQMLTGLNWLSPVEQGKRFQRRRCDGTMVAEILNTPNFQLKGALELLLCTVPQQPPSELPQARVRLKDLAPTRVATGTITPVHLRLDTTQLESGHTFTVAFTHQWSNMTYTVEASPLASLKGVTLVVPWLMLCGNKQGNSADGLYDVHLVIDNNSRSENRKTLTVGSPESEISSSSAVSSAFEPIQKG